MTIIVDDPDGHIRGYQANVVLRILNGAVNERPVEKLPSSSLMHLYGYNVFTPKIFEDVIYIQFSRRYSSTASGVTCGSAYLVDNSYFILQREGEQPVDGTIFYKVVIHTSGLLEWCRGHGAF
jgi:hypothetical protein